MIDLEKMAKEHEKLFPNASLESQIWKLDEELKEFEDAHKWEKINEIADIVIVIGGLYRWCPTVAYHFYDGLTCMDYNWSLVEAEVNLPRSSRLCLLSTSKDSCRATITSMLRDALLPMLPSS